MMVETENSYPLTGFGRIVTTVMISLVAFMFVLDYTIANVAIPYIAGGLAVGVDEGVYVLTSFAVGNGVFIPLTGWLSKRFGQVRTFIWSAALFTFFSFTCGAAPSLISLTISRFLQGAAAGPLVPLAQGLLAQIYPREKLMTVMTGFSLVVLVAPVFGPILGGYICVEYTWRWIFYINIPVGIVAVFFLKTYIGVFKERTSLPKLDFLSLGLLVVGMSSLQIMLDKGEQWDWLGSVKIRVLATLAFLCLSYIVFWSLFSQNALLKLRLFRNRRFAISCFLIFFAYGAYMGSVVIIPLWLQMAMGYNAFWAGLAIAPLGLGALIGSPCVLILSKYIKDVFLIALAFLILAASSYYVTYFSTEVNFYYIGLSRFFFGIGVGLWVAPLMNMPAKALDNHDLPGGLSIFHMLRSVSGGIGSSVFVTLIKRRRIHQHFNLASYFNDYRPESRDYLSDIEAFGVTQNKALHIADVIIDKQAAALSLDEVSMLLVWVCTIMAILSILAYKRESRSLEGQTHSFTAE